MKALALITALCSLAVSITACGPIHNRSAEYVQAENDPSLKLPKAMSSNKIENYYPIPKTSHPDEKVAPADLTPPGLIEAQEEAKKAQKLEKQTKKQPNNSEQPTPQSAMADAETKAQDN